MNIHSEHPFQPPEGERDPLRRFRGRMPAPVSIWTTGDGRGRAGWTVSSFLVADGDPARMIALVDEESPLCDAEPERVVVNLLGAGHAMLADVFAGQAPAPGGAFTTATWHETPWGPRLEGAIGWAGLALEPGPRHVGWALLLEGVVEQVEVADGDALVHRRGRYGT